MISLKSLKLKNFKSWKSLELTNINNYGLTLINGSNGQGKSSVRNAIEYLLLDTFSEPVSVSDIPYNKDTECVISCVLIKDDDEIEITKYRNHKKYGQSIELKVNGDTSLTHTDRRETQKEIFKLLGIDIFSVMATSIYSANSKSFIDGTDSERKNIIYNILDLHKFTMGYDKSKHKLREFESKIENNENILSTKKEHLLSLDNDLKDINNSIEEYLYTKGKELHKLKDELKNLTFKPTDEYEKQIEKLTSELVNEDDSQNIINKINKLHVKKEKYEFKIINILDTIKEKKEELASTKKKLSSYDDQKKLKIEELHTGLSSCVIESTAKYEEKINKLRQSLKFVGVDKLYSLENSVESYKKLKQKLEIKLENIKEKLKEAGDGLCPVISNHKCNLLLKKRNSILDEYNPIIEDLNKELSKINNEIIPDKVRQIKKIEEVIDYNSSITNDIKKIEGTIEKLNIQNEIVKNKIKSIKASIENLKHETNPYIDIIDKIIIPDDSEVKCLETKKADVEREIKKLNKELDSIRVIIESNNKIKKEVANLEKLISNIKHENELTQTNINNVKKSIKTLQSQTNPYLDTKDKILFRIKNTKDAIQVIEQENKVLYEDCKYYKFWVKGFSKTGLPSLLADSFLISLEQETNKILSSISDQMYITISTQKENNDKSVSEKIDIQIHHPDKSVTSLGAYSAGQRQRVKLANLFALNKLISNLDLLFLDEILEGSLDMDGKEQIIELLKEQSKDISTVFVISHDETIKDSFENVINIDMKEGVSYLKGV